MKTDQSARANERENLAAVPLLKKKDFFFSHSTRPTAYSRPARRHRAVCCALKWRANKVFNLRTQLQMRMAIISAREQTKKLTAVIEAAASRTFVLIDE